jgi:Eukaryotic membrane protein family
MLCLQATTLNVAINSSNKALLTIMMSNNFVELKGSVFKKFDKNNLFQVNIKCYESTESTKIGYLVSFEILRATI